MEKWLKSSVKNIAERLYRCMTKKQNKNSPSCKSGGNVKIYVQNGLQALAEMKEKLLKIREHTYCKSNIVDYRYINYDSDEAASAYEKTAELLSCAQAALDTVNNTESLEIPS